MNKREYTQANKDWLTNKAQEDGVKSLPKGIYYKVLAEGKADGKHPMPRSIVTAHYTGRTMTASSLTAAVAVFRWPYVSVTSLKVGSLPCSKCVWAINGRSISLPKWVMASSHSQASLGAPHSFLKLSFLALHK